MAKIKNAIQVALSLSLKNYGSVLNGWHMYAQL